MIVVWCLIITSCNSQVRFEEDGYANNQVGFQEDWCARYQYYESTEDNSSFLIFRKMDDSGYSVMANGHAGIGTLDPKSYTENTDGSYTYRINQIEEWDITYYPSDNDIEWVKIDGSRSRYHTISEAEYQEIYNNFGPKESVENPEKYISEVAIGNRISTVVEYAYTDIEYGYRNVYVVCNISNTSSDTLTFNAYDMFELDNHGIIVNGSSDYDFQKLSGMGYRYNITIVFSCPQNASADISTMSIKADGVKIHLDMPNDENSKKKLEGAYYINLSQHVYIKSNYNGHYNIILISHFTSDASDPPFIQIDDVTLNSDNTLLIGRVLYRWNKENYSLEDAAGDDRTPFKKK